jgi:hypothetical protein
VTARALHIQNRPGYDRRIFALYPPGTEEDGIEAIVSQLSILPHVSVRLTRGRQGGPSGTPVPIIEMLFDEDSNESDRRTSTVKLKELTNPELTISVAGLKVNILECVTCSYRSMNVEGHFLLGMEPKDVGRLWERLIAKMRRLPEPKSTIYDSPYTELTELLSGLLKELGAHVAGVYVSSRPDTRPCTHPS